MECFFSVTRQAIRRGSSRSVKSRTTAIGAFIDHWNEHPHPFDADQILGKIERAKIKTNSLTVQTTRIKCRRVTGVEGKADNGGRMMLAMMIANTFLLAGVEFLALYFLFGKPPSNLIRELRRHALFFWSIAAAAVLIGMDEIVRIMSLIHNFR